MTNLEIEVRLNDILKQFNPCQVKIVNGKAKCADGEPCCTGCKFLSKSGCAKPNMACRFYLCETAYLKLDLKTQKELSKLSNQYVGKLFFRGYISKPINRRKFSLLPYQFI